MAGDQVPPAPPLGASDGVQIGAPTTPAATITGAEEAQRLHAAQLARAAALTRTRDADTRPLTLLGSAMLPMRASATPWYAPLKPVSRLISTTTSGLTSPTSTQTSTTSTPILQPLMLALPFSSTRQPRSSTFTPRRSPSRTYGLLSLWF